MNAAASRPNATGPVRGVGFNGCMECVDGHHDEVVAACGNYTDADKEHPGFPIHYYCGVGWSVTSHSAEHSAEHSTLYCDGFDIYLYIYIYTKAFVYSRLCRLCYERTACISLQAQGVGSVGDLFASFHF